MKGSMKDLIQKTVTSNDNPAVKRIRSLALKKNRDEEKVFLVEGQRHISGALAKDWSIETLISTADARQSDGALTILETARDADARLMDVSRTLMRRIVGRDNAQGMLAVIRQREETLSAVQDGLWLGMEEVRDPGNLGTIIRTCDATDVAGIILIGDCCDPWSLETIRATMGSFARVPLIRVTSKDFLAWRPQYKHPVLGAHLSAKTLDYRHAGYRLPMLMMMGGESHGLTPDVSSICDKLVKIPMSGGAESLNLAVSVGILLYEIRRAKA